MRAHVRQRWAYPVAIAGPVLLAVAMAPFRESTVAPGLAVVLVLPVVGAALLGGRGPGAAAAVIGAASFDVFLTAPFLSLRIDTAEDVLVTAVLLVVGLVVAQLVAGKERSERIAADRERELRSMRRVAGIGAGGEDMGWLVHSACDELAELLGTPDIEFRLGPAPEELPRLGHGKVVVPAGGSTRVEQAVGTVVLPVDRAGQHLAHFVIRYPSPTVFGVTLSRRARAVTVADLLGAAIARAPRISPN